jgi:polar amino acid transport system substrate-binding protein
MGAMRGADRSHHGRTRLLRRLLALTCALAGFQAAGAQPVQLATGAWEPYIVADAPDGGPLCQVVRAACARAGLEPAIQFFPWARCEKLVETGQAAAAFPYAVTAERSLRFDYSREPLVRTVVRVFYVEGRGRDLAWNAWTDFGSAVFAAVPGYWYVEELAGAGVRTETVPSDVLAFRMLKAGRVQYVIDDDAIARPIIREVFGDTAGTVRTVSRPALVTDLYLIVSRSYPNARGVAASIDDAISRMKASGEYDRIMKGLQAR